MTTLQPAPVIPAFLEARLRRWTPDEFARLVGSGVFGLEVPVELIRGEVYEHGRPHVWTRDEYYRLGDTEVLGTNERTELLDGRIVRKVTMNPSLRNNPEPDAMVLAGDLIELTVRHPLPQETLLAVEVSDTTLREDRVYKAGLYARAGIAEYWIVNINDRTLEVHRQPEGGAYGSIRVSDSQPSVAPLFAPKASVRVADLLPLARPQGN